MKITKTASGKTKIILTKSEWQSIGKKAGWEGYENNTESINGKRVSTDISNGVTPEQMEAINYEISTLGFPPRWAIQHAGARARPHLRAYRHGSEDRATAGGDAG